jgi:alkylated DNA repair dioxygenase AlkB
MHRKSPPFRAAHFAHKLWFAMSEGGKQQVPAQTTLELESKRPLRVELGEGCWLELVRGFLATSHQALLEALRGELPWVQELYFRGGAIVPAPRLTSFHGDPGRSYVYSGIRYEPATWTASLLALRATLRSAAGHDFNTVLANLYRDGRDSLGFHSDDEPELGPMRDDIAIASISLGAARRFVLKHKRDRRRLSYELGNGDLLVMRGRTQQRWLHALPKTTRPVGERLNLTFRVVCARPDP